MHEMELFNYTEVSLLAHKQDTLGDLKGTCIIHIY